ncbi:MAG: N-acetylmuramoyl-L-alanine amidase [Candidatus Poribacteria bacterium]|nr:N-acetylmuramoyl-L-alanine amidase [Candidatus Poribacteria bacterium]
MKKVYTYSLVLIASLLLSCAQSMRSSSTLYNAASTRHHQLAHGKIPATDQAWLSLIGEFQHIIDVDPQAEWADDAQYAIASCWIWLGESTEPPPINHAINAFKKLLQDYPNSSHTAEAHYWLGHCYSRLGDYDRAATHYQTVVNHYASHPIAGEAQLHLGGCYERQRHFTSALATYETLSQQSQNSRIVAQAKKRIAYVQSKQAADSKRAELPAEEGQAETPQIVQSASSTTVPEVVEALPEPPEAAKPVVDPSLVQQLGLDVRTIVIDPGHGGKDPGAVSRAGQEKRIVLSLSKMVRDLLVENGYQARLTRQTDVYILLQDRTQFATQHDADLFISIHVNASENADAAGSETYYLALASDESARVTAMRENVGSKYSIKALDALVGKILKESKSTESRRLAQFIQDELILSTQTRDRGVKHAPFVVLIGTQVPAVLIEVGFLSNPVEGKKLVAEAYQRQLAAAIAEGIEQYVRSIPLAAAD